MATDMEDDQILLQIAAAKKASDDCKSSIGEDSCNQSDVFGGNEARVDPIQSDLQDYVETEAKRYSEHRDGHTPSIGSGKKRRRKEDESSRRERRKGGRGASTVSSASSVSPERRARQDSGGRDPLAKGEIARQESMDTGPDLRGQPSFQIPANTGLLIEGRDLHGMTNYGMEPPQHGPFVPMPSNPNPPPPPAFIPPTFAPSNPTANGDRGSPEAQIHSSIPNRRFYPDPLPPQRGREQSRGRDDGRKNRFENDNRKGSRDRSGSSSSSSRSSTKDDIHRNEAIHSRKRKRDDSRGSQHSRGSRARERASVSRSRSRGRSVSRSKSRQGSRSRSNSDESRFARYNRKAMDRPSPKRVAGDVLGIPTRRRRIYDDYEDSETLEIKKANYLAAIEDMKKRFKPRMEFTMAHPYRLIKGEYLRLRGLQNIQTGKESLRGFLVTGASGLEGFAKVFKPFGVTLSGWSAEVYRDSNTKYDQLLEEIYLQDSDSLPDSPYAKLAMLLAASMAIQVANEKKWMPYKTSEGAGPSAVPQQVNTFPKGGNEGGAGSTPLNAPANAPVAQPSLNSSTPLPPIVPSHLQGVTNEVLLKYIHATSALDPKNSKTPSNPSSSSSTEPGPPKANGVSPSTTQPALNPSMVIPMPRPSNTIPQVPVFKDGPLNVSTSFPKPPNTGTGASVQQDVSTNVEARKADVPVINETLSTSSPSTPTAPKISLRPPPPEQGTPSSTQPQPGATATSTPASEQSGDGTDKHADSSNANSSANAQASGVKDSAQPAKPTALKK